MKKLLFLDIETTGLSSNKIVWQVAYAKAVQEDAKLKVLEVVELVGRECIRKKKVRRALEWADVLVAHNVEFEKAFIQYRELPLPPSAYCTMEESTDVCKIERTVWDEDWEVYITYYKWPKLKEAIRILGLKEQLDSMVGGLAYHDALYDVHATMLLYCKLNDLQLQMDGCRIKTANLLRKYVAVRRYAVVGEWEIVESLRAKSFAVRQVDKVVRFYGCWQGHMMMGASWWKAFIYCVKDVWRDLWEDLRSKHPWLERLTKRLTNRNKQAEEEDKTPF